MADTEDLTWVLLVPVDADELKRRSDEYWRKEYRGREDLVKQWEVRQGTGEYAMLVDRNPGSEGKDDIPLARTFSRRVDKPVYLLYMNADFLDYGGAVQVFKKGRQSMDPAEDPYSLAERLGCPLPTSSSSPASQAEEPMQDVELEDPRSACYCEGLTRAATTRALRKVQYLPDPAMHVEAVENGTVIWSDNRGKPFYAWDASELEPEHTFYALLAWPETGAFQCYVLEEGSEKGLFALPEPSEYERETFRMLNEVKGETEPTKIAAALHVPSRLLGLQ